MKKILYILLVVLISTLVLSSCSESTPTSQEVIKLSSSCYLPATHAFSSLQQEWGKEIMARSNGRVDITFYPEGQLAKAPGTLDALEQGAADIAISNIGYYPGRFPVTQALDLPLGYPTGWVGSHVATDFLKKIKPKEWDNLHVLLVNAGTTAGLMMGKTRVTKLEDLQGKTLRGAGEVASAIAALGAIPSEITMAETYDSVSKGVIDGTLVCFETLKSYKMADVCKYTTVAWQVGNSYTFFLAMNKPKWDALPEDIKHIFNEVSEEYSEKYAAAWNQSDIDGINYSLSIPGNEVITLSGAEGARFSVAVQPVLGQYIDKMIAIGYKKSEVEDWFKYIKERINYWKPIEKERGIPSPLDIKLPEG